MKKHIKLFVGHKKPEFPLWEGFSYLELKDVVTNGSDFNKNKFNDTFFNEYSSLFYLKNLLSILKLEPDSITTIAQHRRFVLNKSIGVKSTNQPWANVVSKKEIKNLEITDSFIPLLNNNYLIGSIVEFDSILSNYSRHHYVRDLLRFVSVLVDDEILTNNEAEEFLKQKVLIPAPSCGTFPTRDLLEIIEKVELAAFSFWKNGFKIYNDSYQCRTLGFLLERLNSYFLINKILTKGLDINKILGHTTIISESTIIKHGISHRQ